MTPSERDIEDVIIIGAGPAGLAAALQLKRSGVTPLVLERDRIGGLLHNANLVENYPGFPGGISGTALVRLFAEQAQRLGIHVTADEAVHLAHGGDLFRVVTPASVYQAQVVVIASGTRPRVLIGPQIPPSVRDRILFEVYPLLGMADKRVAVVGAGDAAFDYALNLGKHNDVLILNWGSQVRCLPLLRERASLCPRITYREETRISRMSPAPDGGIDLECQSSGSLVTIRVDYLVGAIGRDPQLGFLSDTLLERAPQLEARGVLHFVGDVKSGMYRQTAIAVGDGLLAAMKICQLLQHSRSHIESDNDREPPARQYPREETST